MPEPVSLWLDVKEHFLGGGLLVGNGASIAFDQRFAYESLFAAARDGGLLVGVEDVFKRFATQDFERVLRLLWTAQGVSDAMGLDTGGIRDGYESIRGALISTIRHIHPTYGEVEERLMRAASFMRAFRTVASLNYDALIYWSMLASNEQNTEGHRFKDAFLHGCFDNNWRRFREPIANESAVTLICYPHGHLVLTRAWEDGDVRKLAADGDLLQTIEAAWKLGKATPLFVTEGTSHQKRVAIAGSPYLNVVESEILPELAQHADAETRTLVTLGWGFGDADSHLLDSAGREPLDRLAVGIDPARADLEDEQRRIRGLVQLILPNNDLTWFDYRSPGCWLNPNEPLSLS